MFNFDSERSEYEQREEQTRQVASVSGGQLVLSARKGKIRHPTSAADYGTAARRLFDYGVYSRGWSTAESTAHDRYCERLKEFITKEDFPISRVLLFDEEFRLQHHDGKREWSDRAADLRDKYLAGPRAKDAEKELASLKLQLSKSPAARAQPRENKKPKGSNARGVLASDKIDGKSVCWDFNLGRCKTKNCPRCHKCWHCGGNHPGNSKACKERPGAVT